MTTRLYYLSVARNFPALSPWDQEDALASLGARRDEDFGLSWVISSAEHIAVLFAMVQARLGKRYSYALTARPAEGETVFSYRRSDNSFARRLRHNSGDLPAVEWEVVQGWFEDSMAAKEAALTAAVQDRPAVDWDARRIFSIPARLGLAAG